MKEKPPIGIMPRWLWLEWYGWYPSRKTIVLRKWEILKAIMRYKVRGKEYPSQWKHELFHTTPKTT